jgi:glyoxalase family protein
MVPQLPGIHHVTAIASDPQQNLDFYVGVLGLRFVKRTVNFDDPGTYHLYYGDEAGSPGTIMTFFAWPGAPRGRVGVGQVSATAFSIPDGSIDFWRDRLAARGVTVEGPVRRLDDKVLAFEDPDGLPLELIASPVAEGRPGWRHGPVPEPHVIHGFHGVTLAERALEEGGRSTIQMLSNSMGFREVRREGERVRFAAPDDGPAGLVDVLCLEGVARGQLAAGTIHHVAWRTPDDAQQLAWRTRLIDLGLPVTEVRDRQYFRSIYFREPGGVLFEIATDPPGFAIDEDPDQLGTSLKLPPWLEPRRQQLARLLLPLTVPDARRTA